MDTLSAIKNYTEFKVALRNELKNQAEGFVRTGYLLKRARDTDILKESGYETVAEFAQAEYGLSKDVVSRDIAINDRYSKDGYSESLEEKYEGYGVAKLQEMLTLPADVVDLMTPDITRREIQEIKREIREEEQISDIEIYLEGTSNDEYQLIQKFIHKYFYENREEFVEISKKIAGNSLKDIIEVIANVLAPSDTAVKMVRIQGVGKMMLGIKGKDNDVELLNIRTQEKETYNWQQFAANVMSVIKNNVGAKGWESIYEEPFKEQKKEEKPKVAPVQPTIEEKEPKKVEETAENQSAEESAATSQQEKEESNVEKVEKNEDHVETEAGEEKTGGISNEPDHIERIEVRPEDVEDAAGTVEEEAVAPVQQEKETIRGYKAGITNKISRLNALWNKEDRDSRENVIHMLDIIKDLEWELEQLGLRKAGE